MVLRHGRPLLIIAVKRLPSTTAAKDSGIVQTTLVHFELTEMPLLVAYVLPNI